VPTDASEARGGRYAVNELVPQPLMIPLAMIMRDELGYGSSKVTFADWNEAVEAFLLDRTDKSSPTFFSAP
jgi:hypothetical protein